MRKQLYDENTPEVKLEIGFRNKENKEVTVFNGTVTPKLQFPPHQFQKMYEIASVQVRNFTPKFLIFRYASLFFLNSQIFFNFDNFLTP